LLGGVIKNINDCHFTKTTIVKMEMMMVMMMLMMMIMIIIV